MKVLDKDTVVHNHGEEEPVDNFDIEETLLPGKVKRHSYKGSRWENPTTIEVEFKYTCDQNFYSSGSAHCDVYCKEEDGSHFECSPNGEKKCSDGWIDQSSNCKIRKMHDL